MAETKKKRGRPKKVKEEVKKVEDVKKVVKRDLDRIPRLSHISKITIYACKIGTRGYKYFWTKPTYPIAWQEEMTGLQAEALLRRVKSSNRNKRLESLALIK